MHRVLALLATAVCMQAGTIQGVVLEQASGRPLARTVVRLDPVPQSSGTKVQLDTNRLHYSEVTLKATFHHTPETVRKAFALIAEKKIRSNDYITGEAPLSRLQQVLRHMLNRNGDIKTAIIPGH